MAETTEFDHDQLGHILADHLVAVPNFQRSYSWEKVNVEEYLADLAAARKKKAAYFMGTLVFAAAQGGHRRKIVDGQQRLASTAILLIAIRDLLAHFNKDELAENTTKRYLRRFDLGEEAEVDSLILSPTDQDSYDSILAGDVLNLPDNDKLRVCYQTCREHLLTLKPSTKNYKPLMEVIDQLEKEVQVLVAVASDLPEAYVIFETLNDRGADLTTADLLKNYLFSQAKTSEFDYVQSGWTILEDSLGKPEDLVKFVRYDFVSRSGLITTRKLYRALQDELTTTPGAKKYVQRLKKAQKIYSALRDPEDVYWKNSPVDVRDALLAYRRFGFESSFPVLLAAFREWDKVKATRLLVKMAKWSVRAQYVGRIGAGLSEEAFSTAAAAISKGDAKNQTEVRALLSKLIPTDQEFQVAFLSAGRLPTARAKYVLAMLEKAADLKAHLPERALDWSSTAITIEHVMPLSAGAGDEAIAVKVDEIGNLGLLEKKINWQLGSKPFDEKKLAYAGSDFKLTQELSEHDTWTVQDITDRTASLAELACFAWPLT